MVWFFSFSALPAGWRANHQPNRPSPASLFLSLFFLFTLIFPLAAVSSPSAPSPLLYNGTPYAGPSLSPIPLSMSCTPFWTQSSWRSVWVSQSPAPLYAPGIHTVIEGMEIQDWHPGSPTLTPSGMDEKSSNLLKTARAQGLDAKEWQVNETRAYANLLRGYQTYGFWGGGLHDVCSGLVSGVRKSTSAYDNLTSSLPVSLLAHSTSLLMPLTVNSSDALGAIDNVVCLPPGVIGSLLSASDINSYPPVWNAAMASSTTALSTSSSAADKIFSDTQNESDKLAYQGAADPQYNGEARSAWQDWSSFVSEAERYSQSSTLVLPYDADLSSSPGLRYARAYRVLHYGIEANCNRPSDPLAFNLFGSTSVVYNDLASDGNSTLLAYATNMRERLSLAGARLAYESDAAQTAAQSDVVSANLSVLAVQKAAWADAYDLPSNAMSDYVESANQWDRTGTYGARKNTGENQLAQAVASQRMAASLQAGKYYFWQSQALLHEQNASALAQSSLIYSSHLLQDMNLSVQSKRAQAQDAIQILNSTLYGMPSGISPQRLQAARLSLFNASQEFDAAARADSALLGPQYTHYVNAISYASNGRQMALSSSNENDPVKVSEMKRLLEDFKRRIGWAENLSVDVSDFNASANNFFSILSDGQPVDGAIDALKAQIVSINSQMDEKLAPEADQFRGLEDATLSLLPYRTDALNTFVQETSVWRKSDAWSDNTYQNPTGLRNQLNASALRIHNLLGSTLQTQLCLRPNAQWLPDTSLVPKTNERTNVGGFWTTSNPLALDYNDKLELSCPAFPVSFMQIEVTNQSPNVQTVLSSDGTLHLQLTGLKAGESASFQFVSYQLPYSLSLKSCQLLLNSNFVQWVSDYRLRALYRMEHVNALVPWVSSIPLASATLSTSGITLQGQPDFSDSSSVLFSIPSPNVSSDWTSDLRSNSGLPMRRESTSAKALASGGVEARYMLTLSSLPSCSMAIIQQTEMADPITGLSVTSSDSTVSVKLVRSPLPGHPDWAVQISPVPSSGSITLDVRYQIDDPAQWVSLTLPVLRTQARVQNDGIAQGLLDQANASAQTQDWPMAVNLIGQAREQLLKKTITDNISLTNSSSLLSPNWDATRLSAQSTLDSLANLTSRLRAGEQRPAWANDIITLRTALKTSLDNVLSDPSPTSAELKSVQTSLNQVSTKSLDLADSDYTSLSKTVNGWRTLSLPDAQVQLRMSEIDGHLLDARNRLQSEDGLGALSSLLDARTSSDAYQSALSSALGTQSNSQSENVHRLSDQFSLTQSQLEQYVSSLQTLNSAGVHAFQPPMTLSAATTLSDQLKKSVQTLPSPDSGSLPSDSLLALKTLASRQMQIDAANQTLSRARPSIDAAQGSLQQGASDRARMVQAYLGEIHLRPTLASSPAASTLDSDAANMGAMMDQQKWPDAIVAGESIITRAKNLLAADTSTSSSAQPPWLMIGLTILLIIGIAYVLIMRKPPKEKHHAQLAPKTLGRVAGA